LRQAQFAPTCAPFSAENASAGEGGRRPDEAAAASPQGEATAPLRLYALTSLHLCASQKRAVKNGAFTYFFLNPAKANVKRPRADNPLLDKAVCSQASGADSTFYLSGVSRRAGSHGKGRCFFARILRRVPEINFCR
jgi:hypothetical protein